jgi:RNase P/RNase MRP subunit p30
MILQTTNLQEIRSQIQKIKKSNTEEPILVKAQDEEFNRKVLEIKGVNILLGPEIHNTYNRKDKLKQRDSGLNEFLCKLAAKNNVKIAINVQEIASLSTLHKAKALARIIQNIQLCKRTKTQIILWPENKYKSQDIMAFITTLKGSTQQGKNIQQLNL